MAAMRMFSGQRLMGGSGLTLPVLKRTRSLMNACLPSIIPASFPSPTMRSHMRSAPMWAQRMGLLGVPLRLIVRARWSQINGKIVKPPVLWSNLFI